MGDNVVTASQGLTEFRTVSKVFNDQDLMMLGASVKQGLDIDPKTHDLKGRDADGSKVEIDLSDTFRNNAGRVAAYGFATITDPEGHKKSGSFYYSEGPSQEAKAMMKGPTMAP